VPEYAYKCTECGHEFSVRKRIAEAARPEACQICGCDTRRVWSVPAIAGPACGTGGGSGSG
jgi:putative FmdB family regulatory protein